VIGSPEALLDRVDPELRAQLAGSLASELPDGELDVETVRALDTRLAPWVRIDDVHVERVPRPDGTLLELRVHPGPGDDAILWIHGGGMFLGAAWTDDVLCRGLARDTRASVVAVDYRLAPEHPHPAPLDDCILALDRIAGWYRHVVVAGTSAGGGLAAGLALRVRDSGGPDIAAQHLYAPMLDDRGVTSSSVELAETVMWNRRLNDLGWSAYLSGAPADQYAAPARAIDLSGLPPAYVDTGELDLFRDEDACYALRLAAAAVPVEFHLERGAVHAFDVIAPDAAISRSARTRRIAALRRDLRGRM
jgi:acetyl esterase/lipase